MLKLWSVVVAISAATAFGADSSKAAMANIEAGVRWGSSSAGNGVQWLVDSMKVRHAFEVSDRVKVVMQNALYVNGPTAATAGTGTSDVMYAARRTSLTIPTSVIGQG